MVESLPIASAAFTRRGRPRGPPGTAPVVDENTGRISGVGVAAHHDVGVAALLEVRIKHRLAVRAPAPPAERLDPVEHVVDLGLLGDEGGERLFFRLGDLFLQLETIFVLRVIVFA